MRKFNQTEKLAFAQQHPNKPVLKWQVVIQNQILFESVKKGLCIWWCDRHAIKRENIKSVY